MVFFFLTWYRLNKLVVMLMTLINVSAMFLWIMNNLSMDMLDKRVVIFLDEILSYGTTVEEYSGLLEKVYTCLYKHAFYCKLKKCRFLHKTTTFLEFDITPEGMHISDAKVRSIKEWLMPTTIQ